MSEVIRYLRIISGVYKITHIPSGWFYLGESGDIYTRIRHHFSILCRGKHENHDLQCLWNQSSLDDFYIEIIYLTTDKKERHTVDLQVNMSNKYSLHRGKQKIATSIPTRVKTKNRKNILSQVRDQLERME